MARLTRNEFPGGVYYIKAGGKDTESIFRDPSDRARFLDILSETAFRFKWLCHSYCLLDDHYHLLLETPCGRLSLGMRQINGLYTQSFNKKYGRQGPLFGERFRSIIIEKTRYLLPLHRHMMLNPVRANLASEPKAWPWSSYLPNILKGVRPGFLFTQWILSFFQGKDKALALERYERYISSGSDECFLWQELKERMFLGSDSFIEKVKKRLQVQNCGKRDMNSWLRSGERLALKEIFGTGKLPRKERDSRIYHAYIHQGYTLSEIAAFLNIHLATASRAVRRMEKKALKQVLRT